MMNSTDNNQPDSEIPEEGQHSSDKASPNLNAAAEEAMRLLNDNKALSETLDVPADDVSSNPESTTSNDATEQVSPVEDDAENGNTTNDLQQEAYKAMQLEAEQKREAASKIANEDKKIFLKDMRLKLTSKENSDAIIKAVEDELVVGRADNVTDYVPDIDLTPHGAYRLGLSRRHAIILRDNDSVCVKDLNSRNGTFVNGAIVPGGSKQIICDGDKVRFGNLIMHATFIASE